MSVKNELDGLISLRLRLILKLGFIVILLYGGLALAMVYIPDTLSIPVNDNTPINIGILAFGILAIVSTVISIYYLWWMHVFFQPERDSIIKKLP